MVNKEVFVISEEAIISYSFSLRYEEGRDKKLKPPYLGGFSHHRYQINPLAITDSLYLITEGLPLLICTFLLLYTSDINSSQV